MNKDIEITTSQKGNVSVINIKGDVTAVTGESVENAYQEISSSGTKRILLHFDQECYINSGGIAVLIGIVSESRKKEQIVRATGLSEHFQKIFNMVGLTKYIQHFPSEESALAEF
jgi:anti-sigma B factor antagonist